MTKKPIALTIALAFAASITLYGCDSTASLTEQEHIQRAKDYEDKGNLKGSIVELKNAIQKNPNNPQARLLLGQIYLKVGLGAEAEKELGQAEKLGVNRESIKLQLGEALLLMGEYKRVLDEINPSEQTSKPNLARIYQIRADAMLNQGRLKDACNLYQQSLDIDKENPPTYWGLAQCAVAERDMVKAKAWLDAALELNSRQAETWTFIGNLEQFNKNTQAALTAFTHALQSEPNNIEALRSRSALNIALGQLEAAQTDVDKIVRLAPKSLSSYYMQALLNFEREKYPEARDSLQEVFKITSNYMPSILLAGATDYALGSYQQAESHLAKYLSRYPRNSYGRRMLAATQIKQKEADKALETLAPLLTGSAPDTHALVLAAEAYRMKREPSKAAEYLARASAIDPKNASIQTELGFSHLAAGDSQLAITELVMAASLDPGQPKADVLLVTAYLNRKEYDKALAAIDALEKKLQNSALTHTMRGDAFNGKNDFSDARKSYEQALAIDPVFFPAAASLAKLDMRDKNPGAARKRFESVLNKDKNNLLAMIALAELAEMNKQEKDAVNWLERAAKAHPEAIPPRTALARYLLAKKEPQKALAIANEAVNANPKNPAALDLLGSVQLAMKDNTGALSTFTKLAQQTGQSPDALLHLAIAQIANNRLADARINLHKALELQPEHEQSLDAMIRLDMKENKPDQALRIAQQLQASRPQSPLGFDREGDILLSQKRYPEAAKSFEKALTKGGDTTALMKLHRALIGAGDTKAADKRLDDWIKQNPQDLRARVYAAEVYMQSKRNREAISQYEVVLKASPNNVIALNNLAILYQSEKDSRALATAEQALKIAPDHPGTQDTLGWILLKQGQLPRSLDLLGRASAKEPRAASVRYHYGVALARAGKKEAAKKELKAAVTNGQKFQELEDAKALLNSL